MGNNTDKPEFWETSFIDKQTMWGFAPAHSAVLARDIFVKASVRHVLVPGIGYGRNAQLFVDSGMAVTGIEISQTAIALAKRHYGSTMTIHHGSVSDMPFDHARYDGIFCYALIHLLDSHERARLINNCYTQLADGGTMVFTAISKEAHTYGQGQPVSKDRYEIFDGMKMFFYDRQSIQREFGQAGLAEIIPVSENFPFFLITCKKDSAHTHALNTGIAT